MTELTEARGVESPTSPSELDTIGRVDRVRTNTHLSPLTSWQVSTMTLPISLSAAAIRTNPSSISHLMQTALENPGIVSLAAGFVDQQSLPVEMVAQAAAEPLRRSDGRTAGPSIRNDDRRPEAADTTDRIPGKERRPSQGLIQGGHTANDRHDGLGPVDLSGLRGASGPRRYRPGGIADLLRFPGTGRDAWGAGHPGFRSTTAGSASIDSRRPWLFWRARESSNGSR